MSPPPPADGSPRQWLALGIKAYSVLMGYKHNRFTKAPGVANDAAASWRALGNTIQAEVLESVVKPWIDAAVAAGEA